MTVVRELFRLLPSERVLYFGDTARLPYGSKSEEVVTQYSREISKFLLEQDVKMVVVACNTASAFALPTLRQELPVPVIGVIGPGARAALAATRNRKIGVIGTEGTVASHAYAKALRANDKTVQIHELACPLFVPLVEEGWLARPESAAIARRYLTPLKKRKIDTLILGCTHYPLLKKIVQKIMGPKVTLIDSAEETAKEVRLRLGETNLLHDPSKRSNGQASHFYVSDASAKFKAIGEKFLGTSLAHVKKIRLG